METVWCPGCEREADPIILSGIPNEDISFIECSLCHYRFEWKWYNIKVGDKFFDKTWKDIWKVVDFGTVEGKSVVKLIDNSEPTRYCYEASTTLLDDKQYKRIRNGDSGK